MAKVHFMLEEAGGRRSCLIELPWSAAGIAFILTCQWEAKAEEPVWTLYEDDYGTSKVLWTQSFPAHEIEFMYDILVMSAPKQADTATSVEDLLKGGDGGAAEWRFDDNEESYIDDSQAISGPHLDPTPAQPNPRASQTGLPQQEMPDMQQYQMPPGAPYPYPMPPGYPYQMQPGQMMPYQQYPMQPGMQPMQMQPGMQPMQMQPGMQPMQMQPGMQSGMPGGYPGLGPQGMQAPPTPFPPPATTDDSNLTPVVIPLDYHLLDKRPNMLLGTMLVDAGLLNGKSLEAALKLQDLIREGKLPATRAPAILKKHHEKGSKIEEYVTPMDKMSDEPAPKPKSAAKPDSSKAPSGQPQKSGGGGGGAGAAGKRNLKPAFDLIQKAGVLTDSDVEDALGVRRKHGGDLVNILEAAGKLNRKTVDAAFICLTLIREGLMKPDKCYIALNYCSRMRVGFDEALDEMGWDNPRKLRSDLPL